VLAYLFWHRPRPEAPVEAYEHAQIAFHRSLAHRPPVGMFGSALFRADELPWLPGEDGVAGYEDWYLLEDHAALGVLGEAAVGRGHRTAHDEAARRFGRGAGGLYGLLEGDASAELLGGAPLAVWVGREAGARSPAEGELLGDGMDPRHASLWRRQLVLGPAPEFCLVAPEAPSGVAPSRLAPGWTATTLQRRVLWSG